MNYDQGGGEVNICCKKFADYHGIRYVGIEFVAGGWSVNGCCGGCFVLVDIKFCPFCGVKLEAPPPAHQPPEPVMMPDGGL